MRRKAERGSEAEQWQRSGSQLHCSSSSSGSGSSSNSRGIRLASKPHRGRHRLEGVEGGVGRWESAQEARRDAGAEPAAKAEKQKARVSPAGTGRNEQEKYCRGRGEERVREGRRGEHAMGGGGGVITAATCTHIHICSQHRKAESALLKRVSESDMGWMLHPYHIPLT